MTPQTMQSSLKPINRAQMERVVAARVPYISQGGSWLLSDLRNIRAAPLIKKEVRVVTATATHKLIQRIGHYEISSLRSDCSPVAAQKIVGARLLLR
jgi:hypothetical protein